MASKLMVFGPTVCRRLRPLSMMVLTWVLLGLGSQVAHGEGRPLYGQSLVSSLLEEPLVVDPIAARSHADMSVIALIFDTLYRVEGGKVIPHLAAAMPDASDPLRVSIPLRLSVQFHDGTTLRPLDVVASLQRLKKSELGFLLEGVKRIDEAPRQDGTEPGAAIVITLRKADPGLARRLADLHTSIVARGQAPQWRRLAGTGPWRLKQRSARRSALVLKPFEKHFAGRPYLDELILQWHGSPDAEARQYEAGSTHVSARGHIAFAGHQPKYQTSSIERESGVLAYLGFGRTSPITGEAEFRKAISAAIGRLGMSQIGSGETVDPTTTVLAPRRRPRRFALQANAAVTKQLLRGLAQRYPRLEAKTLALELIVNASRPDDAVIAGRVAAALFVHGIKTRIVSLSADVFARRSRTGQCDLFIGQLAQSGGSPLAQLRKAFVVGRQARTALALSGQSKPAIERRFDHDLPLVPLFRRSLKLHFRSDVHGLELSETQTPDYPGVFFHGSPVKN